MKANSFSKISMGVAAATLVIVVGFVQLSLPSVSSEEGHLAGAMMALAVFGTAAMIGLVLGVIGILFAGAALIRKERLALVLLAFAANLPIPILSAVLLVRNFKSR
jgi:hypothetical protein